MSDFDVGDHRSQYSVIIHFNPDHDLPLTLVLVALTQPKLKDKGTVQKTLIWVILTGNDYV